MASMQQFRLFGVALFFYRLQGLLLVHRPELDINASAFLVPFAKDCVCDIRQLECLPSPRCMAVALANEGARVAEGMAIRKSMRTNMVWIDGAENQYLGNTPVGKGMQFGNILAWKSWMTAGTMSAGFSEDPYLFIDPARYPFCEKHRLQGRACAFKRFAKDENRGEVEMSAAAGDDLEASVADFSKYRQNDLMMEQARLSPNFYFLSFAHVLRLRFNVQPSFEDSYQQRLVELNPGLGHLRVSLHIRRADSCRNVEHGEGFAPSKSALDLEAQIEMVRVCYATDVYMDELRRVQRMYGKPLTVFLATDAGTTMIEEIKTNYTELFNQFTWRYLDYTADTFQYHMVDDVAFVDQQSALVGESAISDLWHMSHGEVFIGHLGSRYGKMGYVLAAARHNSLVPYVSVDGHSLCCEIDESCAPATSRMHGMLDCLGYAHDQMNIAVNEDYLKKGSTVRWSVGDR